MSNRDQDKLLQEDSRLSILLECCICFHGLRECHICVECSQPFCRECIDRWLLKESSCPYCRAHIEKNRLVRFYLIDQLHEAVARLLAEQNRNRCEVHGCQQLLLVCLHCEECVCVDCWYSDGHVEHKDEIVPMEIAYDHFYRETMKTGQSNKLKVNVKEESAKLKDKIKVLFDEPRDASTMNQILELSKMMEKLQIDEKNLIPS
ncbi:AAEL003010-PA [Aedes aegypti]|uniref:AAEL003010-PA n=2 Tax=Aedes aegypti TaxID=7159 RepID=A0A1S4F3K6_AEDAE|nr:E3 ubiquitin-protein ligase TRIM39 [Aedes aegypti]EAT45734.1 AAEL003010-PA [Aedes aegypti]